MRFVRVESNAIEMPFVCKSSFAVLDVVNILEKCATKQTNLLRLNAATWTYDYHCFSIKSLRDYMDMHAK